MAKQFDLVVIGTGTAARGTATRMRAAGWSVAVIDSKPYGGTCALRGCDPKKMLVGAASAIDHARRMRGKGVSGVPQIDRAELIAFKRGFTDPVPEKHEGSYAEKGIATFHGRACFTGRNRVEVEGAQLEARHVLIATGAAPVTLGIPGEEHLTTSTEFLELPERPDRIAFVGGGFIAMEFAHIVRRAGSSKVTVLEMMDRPLGPFDPDLVAMLVEATEELGVDHLVYLERERMNACGRAGNENIEKFCNACFTGEYPTGDITPERLRSIAGDRCRNRGETLTDESAPAGV